MRDYGADQDQTRVFGCNKARLIVVPLRGKQEEWQEGKQEGKQEVMRKLRILASAVGCAVALEGGIRGYGADNDTNSCEVPLNSPAGLSVTASLKHGQTVFRKGEIITLVIRTTSETEGEYLWNSKNYDRMGRNDLESFCIQPDSGRDPLRDYFDSQAATIGGGLFNELPLGRTPQTTELDLNEWHSLPAGHYRLRVVSDRVSVIKKKKAPTLYANPIPLRSNPVEFTVVEAEPEWQAEQIRLAVDELHRGNTTVKTTDAEGQDIHFEGDQRIHAKRVLRFMETRQSEHEIAVLFAEAAHEEPTWEYAAGLWGATDRAAVIEDMKAVLQGHHLVNESFVRDLAEMEMYSDPKWRSLLHEGDAGEAWEAYLAELNRRTDAYMSKTGVRRALTQ